MLLCRRRGQGQSCIRRLRLQLPTLLPGCRRLDAARQGVGHLHGRPLLLPLILLHSRDQAVQAASHLVRRVQRAAAAPPAPAFHCVSQKDEEAQGWR